MSKFFYSGSLEQVNYLSQKDIFLRFLYGNWISMLIEGILFILYAGLIIVYEVLNYYDLIALPEYSIVYGIVGLCLILATTFFITYTWAKKNNIANILKQRSILDLIIAVVLFLFPFFLNGIVGFAMVIFGLYLFENKKKPRKLLGSLIMIFGALLVFNFNLPFNYVNWIYVVLLLGFGVFLVRLSLVFRRSVKNYTDEQQGFTDYTIE